MNQVIRLFLVKNKEALIVLVLILIILIYVYYRGKRSAQDCGWYDRLLGRCSDKNDEPRARETSIPSDWTGPGSGSSSWKPGKITDSIYDSYQDYSKFFGGGDDINAAWATFNSLNNSQKLFIK